MSDTKQDDQFGGHANLAEALAAFQADMPAVGKDKTAQVPTKSGGSYSYKYADLADVAKAGHPKLSAHGLLFTSKPTLNADGAFVLAYALRHVSGESDEGEFPLPSSAKMQEIGGVITYARRYAFCAVTGLVADEDTDGRGDAEVDTRRERAPRPQHGQRQQPPAQRNGQQDNGQSARPDPVEKAKAQLRELLTARNLDATEVAARYEQQYGETLKQATDPTRVQAFTKLVEAEPAGASS